MKNIILITVLIWTSSYCLGQTANNATIKGEYTGNRNGLILKISDGNTYTVSYAQHPAFIADKGNWVFAPETQVLNLTSSMTRSALTYNVVFENERLTLYRKVVNNAQVVNQKMYEKTE